MKTQKYIAKDLEKAIRQARRKHGEEAMILTIADRSNPAGVEVTFAFDMDDAEFADEYERVSEEWEKATEAWEKAAGERDRVMDERTRAQDEALERIENDPEMTEDDKLEATMKACEGGLLQNAEEMMELVAGVEEHNKIKTKMAGYLLERARRSGVQL